MSGYKNCVAVWLFQNKLVQAGQTYLGQWIDSKRGIAFSMWAQQTASGITSVQYAIDLYFLPGPSVELDDLPSDFFTVALGTKTDFAAAWTKYTSKEFDDPFVAYRGRVVGGVGIPDTTVNFAVNHY